MKGLIKHEHQTQQQLQRDAFERLEDVPPEIEWFGNIQNKHTKRAYLKDVQQFSQFSGITQVDDLRDVTRAYVIAFRNYLQRQDLAAATIRRKIAALGALFDHLCNVNSMRYNPCSGVKRPTEGANEGKTPALSNEQAKRMLCAPPEDILKGVRDRAILLYHGLRREELCKLKVKDIEHQMKQENRFVADLYHFLSPFMDKDKDLYLCMDGGAAKHHAASEYSKLEDAVLPDIWFCLVGQEKHIGIEAKVFDSNSLSFRQVQIQSWKSGGGGVYTPKFWVATNRELTRDSASSSIASR